jgi:hypothetical protein
MLLSQKLGNAATVDSHIDQAGMVHLVQVAVGRVALVALVVLVELVVHVILVAQGGTDLPCFSPPMYLFILL